jgi:hypothetical protein
MSSDPQTPPKRPRKQPYNARNRPLVHPEKAPKNPRKPTKEETQKRRDLVETLLSRCYGPTQIRRVVNAEHSEKWSRETIARDVSFIRKKWAREASGLDGVKRRAALEKMCMTVFNEAMRLQKPVVHRTKQGDVEVVRTEMEPAPDLRAATKAVERMAALYGLNITKVEGTMGVTGASDIFGKIAATLDNDD